MPVVLHNTVLRSASWHDSPAPAVSVAVSTYGRGELLPRLVACLEAQQEAPPFEVVIADNGSADGTWEVLRRLVETTTLPLAVVRLPVNRGAGGGRHAAVAQCRGALLAFTDDDCLPASRWLTRLTAAFAAADDVVLVQGRTEPEPGPSPGTWARSVWVTAPTPWLETCNIAYRRTDYDAVGGFPEDAEPGTRAFGEDTWLGHRVLSRGGRRAFAADAVVHHRWRPGTFADHLAERRVMRGFPRLAAQLPGVAESCWGGVFLSRRTAATDLAVASALVAAGLGRPALLLGAAPWLRTAWAPARARRGPVLLRLAQAAAADLMGLAALVRGSVEHRRLLL